MEIFLSWSGDWSKKLAQSFREWIPLVLQDVKPFMSSKDISIGSNWNESINKHLNNSSIGLIFLTPENIDSPWINFEAGGLSKSLTNQTKIIPILFDKNKPKMTLSKTPLKQFQSLLIPEEKEFKRLIESINEDLDLPVEESYLIKIFDKWWPDLESKLNEVNNSYKSKTSNNSNNKKSEKDMSLSLLTDVSSKMDFILSRENELRRQRRPPMDISEATKDLLKAYTSFVKLYDNSLETIDKNDFEECLVKLRKPITYLRRMRTYRY